MRQLIRYYWDGLVSKLTGRPPNRCAHCLAYGQSCMRLFKDRNKPDLRQEFRSVILVLDDIAEDVRMETMARAFEQLVPGGELLVQEKDGQDFSTLCTLGKLSITGLRETDLKNGVKFVRYQKSWLGPIEDRIRDRCVYYDRKPQPSKVSST